MGHARAILAVEDPEARRALARRVEAEKLSVRDVERLAQDWGKVPAATTTTSPAVRSAHVTDLERQLAERLGTRVRIADHEGRGRIAIEYYSAEDLDRLLELIAGAGVAK